LVSSICSRLRNTVKAKIINRFSSTRCVHALSSQVNASPPEESLG
jgi:hypothetical protein